MVYFVGIFALAILFVMSKSMFVLSLVIIEKVSHGVADMHLKIGKIPVYSANPWIDSFAHTV